MRLIREGTISIRIKLIIVVAVFLVLANTVLGMVLMYESKESIKSLINQRMLDISNTAADMINGDDLKSLNAEDKGTKKYNDIYNDLKVFRDNIDLEYIYAIADKGNKKFTFIVDTDEKEPGAFGSSIVYTDALYKASKGKAAVDDRAYKDEWGSFYSAYSPVMDSKGKVAGIIAVDFSAKWFDSQIAKQTDSFLISTLAALLLGVLLIVIFTHNLMKKMRELNNELMDLSYEVDDLTHLLSREVRINHDAALYLDDNDPVGGDEIHVFRKKVHAMKEEIHGYINDSNVQANRMINVLASDYHGVYYVDLKADRGVCYRSHSKLKEGQGLNPGDTFPFKETFDAYADAYVDEKYREEFRSYSNIEKIRDYLEDEPAVVFHYIVNIDGEESYEMIKISAVQNNERTGERIDEVAFVFADVDVETRVSIEQRNELIDALYSAREASEAKTVFLSNMSHEIRTPMNAIIGLDHLALNDPDIPEKTRKQLEQIGISARHLLKIINDILDMTRIETGKMILNEKEFSMPDLLEQINAMIGGQCEDKGIIYSSEIKGDVAEYYLGDEMKLKQIMINILGNAVKFTPAGKTVDFIVEKTAHYDDKSTFVFTMKDTGKGMDKDFIPKLFDTFSQEEQNITDHYGSTGLGMPITKSLVEMMNGKINVESEKGKGTTFKVTVTLADCTVKKEEAAGDSTQPATDLAGKRILLAEDMSINAQIISMILAMQQIEVECAEDGQQAVDKFSEKPEWYYDAILMDIRMPVMNGLEATAAIRDMDRSDAVNIPIIALTANAFSEDVQRSIQAGMNAHLSKPVEPDELFETLESFFKVTKS